MPSQCDFDLQATWSKRLKRAEEDGSLRCDVLTDTVTARETGNASRITMNEGVAEALRCNDTAASSVLQTRVFFH